MRLPREALPLLVVLGVFAWSAVSIALRRAAERPPGVQVIRIGHWQLESGVRDGFAAMAVDFSALPAVQAKYGRVQVVQDAIPESTYGQWVSTQMIAGTAPDLVEVGLGLPAPVWLAYQNRYFEPLTNLASAPNPFNQGTVLEGVPLKNTIGDGLRSGYQEELQQYMRVPLSRFTSRVYYNRDLLAKLTGLDEPPHDYRTFLSVCRTIGAARNAQGEAYVPIASSRYHAGMWQTGLFDPLTYSVMFRVDFNRDGAVGSDETYVGFRRGVLSFQTPAVRARFEAARQIQQEFQPGFAGLTRDEAVFLFAQQRAVFISTGTWDAGGLTEQARGKFTVGAMAYPQPTPDDPEYGSLIAGPNFDPAGPGFMFGVTRFSKNPELAKDFLLYLISLAGNQKLNETIGWIPSVVGARVPTQLAGFRPVNRGMYSNLNFDLGGETVLKYQQLYSRYQNDPSYSYDAFAKDFEPFYAARGLTDWNEQQRDWRRSEAGTERILTALRVAAMAASDDPSDPAWVHYRAATTARQIIPALGHAIQQQLVREGSGGIGPYEYRPEALDNVRRRAATRPSRASTGVGQ